MRKPRRRQEGMSHSISCKDEEWEMVCKGAERAGMNPSAWFTQCALNVNPLAGRTIPLVLDEEQQGNVVKAIERLGPAVFGQSGVVIPNRGRCPACLAGTRSSDDTARPV